MDLAFVKKVLKLVEESNVNEIELEEKGVRVRITKNANNAGVPSSDGSIVHAAAAPCGACATPHGCTRTPSRSGKKIS